MSGTSGSLIPNSEILQGVVDAIVGGTQRTPGRRVTTSNGSVSPGAIAVSIHNHSDSITATVKNFPLPPGETVDFAVNAPDTLAEIEFTTNGAQLHINEVR